MPIGTGREDGCCDLPGEDGAHLRVLASGSAGNCSVLVMNRGGRTRAVLLDLGLSPRKTWRLLAEMGLGEHQVDGALVTHLDSDHARETWRTLMPPHARVYMHGGHAERVRRDGWRVEGFDGPFLIDPEVRVFPLMMSHDQQGVAAFRVEFTGALAPGRGRASLGFATDLGRVDARLVEHFRGGAGQTDEPVDVLAIESNYCPAMQRASNRPEQLKQRIMGGRGHLSNQEALSAALQIEPREHVVLLHLSRECNHPSVVAPLHAGADYALTITSQEEPSRWVRIGSPEPRPHRGSPEVVSRPQPARPLTLFGSSGPGA